MFENKRLVEDRADLTEAYVLEKLKGFSNILQLEYLEKLNKRDNLLPGIKVLVCKKISEIYEGRNLYSIAATSLKQAISHVVLAKERKELLLKLGILWMKAGELLSSTDAFNEALKMESPSEVRNLQKHIRSLYLNEASNLEKIGKMAKASAIYERMLRYPQEGENTDEIKIKLANLYKKLGKTTESLNLMNSMKPIKK